MKNRMKTQTSRNHIMKTMKRIKIIAAILALTGLVGGSDSAADSINVANPSFEQDGPLSPPGYGTPTGWAASGGPGINDASGPFWDNGAIVDSTYVCFIQGNGLLGQSTTGYQVGETYWIQLFVNARTGPTTPTLTVYNAASTAGGAALVPDINVTPVGGGNPFTFINVPFTAAATSGDLNFAKGGVGDNTLLLDGISITRRSTNDIVIANPSFEASGTGQAGVGVVGAVAGWTLSGAGGPPLINQTGGPYLDSGEVVPDGNNVLVIQGVCAYSQTLHGLTPGQNYRLTLYVSGRSGDVPTALITIDGNMAYNAPVPQLGSSPFQLISYDFIASAADVTLSIGQTTDTSYFVDNVRVAVQGPLLPQATILNFGTNVAGSSAVIGPVVAKAATIAWTVPYGTVLADLAPSFTLSSGATCNRTSAAIPTPNFGAGPVTYTVISSDSLITNVYTVTATTADQPGTWTYSAWTGDADSGITNASFYTVAVNCNGSAVTVNGVAFQASALSGANFSISGAVSTFVNGAPNITGDSLTLASTFIYDGKPRTVTLTHLTPGVTYETTFFSYGFDAVGRIQTFASGSDSLELDQDFYGAQNGIRISYTFVAGPSGSKVLTITPVGASGSFHMCALASMMFATEPQIISQPQPVTTNYGASATFTAVVQTTNPPLAYAWYKGSTLLVDGMQAGGSTVSGAQGTNSGSSLTATLTLINVSYQDDGSYSLFVTNNANNSVSTIPATLTVNDPYIVTQPPFTVVVPVGGATTIPVVAAGSGPVTYQWYSTSEGQLSDGARISGSHTAILTITNAQPSDGASYYVVVNGASGSSVQSSNEIVYVESTQLGPFGPSDWPPSVAPSGIVDYAIFDPNNSFAPPPGWNNVMSLTPSGGDQTFVGVTYGGLFGNDGTSVYFNFIDPNWASFANVPVIDILMQVYGNSAIYNADGTGLSITFQEGQVGYGHNVSRIVPQGANNGEWNWILFEIPNPINPSTGFRYVGDTSHATQSDGTYGGVNGGTIRWFGGNGSVNGITIRAVAVVPQGAFGSTNQVNRFATPTNCPSEPNVNLAYVDFNSGVTNHLTVLTSDNLGEPLGYNLQSGVGPAGDLRTAIQSSSTLMNFAILSNYLGQPCNPALTMQLCVEFYDDPSLAGSTFGPHQYATDAQGDLANYGGSPYTMTGSGRWLKVAFYLGPVCLEGVGTAPLTGGPTVIFNGNLPYIDRVELGVIRQGTNALAGLTPDPSYHMDPFICDTNYGYYAEWNPSAGVTNNVDVAPGYSTVLAGPSYDLRLAERANLAAPGVYYLEFALLNNVFGPALQDNADVTMLVTYYDDPALVGAQIFPNVYETWIDGNSSPSTPSAPYNVPVTLQGSGQWKDAYFELPNVNFVPNSVCRYATYSSAPVYVSRVRYDVIRPCGPFEGINYLQTLRITGTSTNVNVNWFGTASLLSAQTVAGLYSSIVTVTNTVTNTYTDR